MNEATEKSVSIVEAKNPYYGIKEISGRVKSISFDSGRIDLADKEKTYLFAPSSMLLDICKEVLTRPYLTFKIDGKIITEAKKHEFVK